jgi:hypothetical protein
MQSERRISPAVCRGPKIPKVDPKTGASHFTSDLYIKIARVRTEDGRSREAVTIRNPGTRGARTHARLPCEIIVPDAQASHRVQSYPRHERGEPDCSRRRKDVKERVTNPADTSVWLAHAAPASHPVRAGRERLRGERRVSDPAAPIAHQGRRVSLAHTDRGDAPVSL